LIFLKFAPSVERIEIERLNFYLIEASFCLSATRLEGTAEFDYICQLVFDTKEQFDFVLRIMLRRFESIISQHVIYRVEIVKQIPYRIPFDISLGRKKQALMISLALKENINIQEKLRQFTLDIWKCIEAKCVCLWLIDKETDELILTNAYGNYEYIPPEYAEISLGPIDLKSIMQEKNSVLVNDLANELKGINVDWLMKENVRAYAGYPLESNDRVVGVLEIFTDKVFELVDFELLQSLSAQVSDELSKVY
jgi:transcriptional regulator with GAF, ATPase, and Fis domain